MDILNQEKIQQLANEIGQENIPMLLDIFVGELSSYMAILTECPQAERSKQLGEISHALKSSAASFGADKLCALALDVDSQVKAGSPVGDDELLEEFVALLSITHDKYAELI